MARVRRNCANAVPRLEPDAEATLARAATVVVPALHLRDPWEAIVDGVVQASERGPARRAARSWLATFAAVAGLPRCPFCGLPCERWAATRAIVRDDNDLDRSG